MWLKKSQSSSWDQWENTTTLAFILRPRLREWAVAYFGDVRVVFHSLLLMKSRFLGEKIGRAAHCHQLMLFVHHDQDQIYTSSSFDPDWDLLDHPLTLLPIQQQCPFQTFTSTIISNHTQDDSLSLSYHAASLYYSHLRPHSKTFSMATMKAKSEKQGP